MVAPAKQIRRSYFQLDGLDDLTPQAAKGILRIRFSKSDQARVKALIARSKRSELTREQEAELDGYLKLGSLLTIMHSRARMALARGRSSQRRKVA